MPTNVEINIYVCLIRNMAQDLTGGPVVKTLWFHFHMLICYCLVTESYPTLLQLHGLKPISSLCP